MDSDAGKAWIAAYLASHPEYTSAEPLEGGVSNYLYRLTKTDGSTVVLKHAEPHAAHDENWAMDMARVESERAALVSIADALQSSDAARRAAVEIPRVIAYDEANHNLIMADCGTDTKDLHTAFPSLSPQQRVDVGRRLGMWLAALHQSSTIDKSSFGSDEPQDRQGTDQRISMLCAGLPSAGLDTDEAVAEKKAFVALLEPFVQSAKQPSQRCVIHGDFWPGNVLVGATPGGEDASKDFIAVIDWEGVGLGTGALDVGAMAAEAWLLCHFHRTSARASVAEPEDFGMFEAFLRSYLETAGKVEHDFVKEAVVQFAINLPVGRGGKELMRPVNELGCKIARMIMGNEVADWQKEVLKLGWGTEAWRDWFASQ